ncbi:tetraacyldisaccharide 4'-kinase [Neisseriaceae bacterium TC5R-5]|nr:tetraacyldisaccharide 4'-kinase [Neisseriaceae bacterium TC5R-5]
MIEQHWYRPRWWLTALLVPLEGLFALLSTVRRYAYRRGWFSSYRLDVPVVVVGNINIGGVGKTPLILALAQAMQQQGVRVGVISRGYGGTHSQPTLVTRDSSPAMVGDEPLLLATAGLSVVVGRDRVAAGQYLLHCYPELQLILSDDGLQHYRLQRDLEIVVLDGERGFGNGHLLPVGPLRESRSRLNRVDALVINGAESVPLVLPEGSKRFTMELVAGELHALGKPTHHCSLADCQQQRIVAMAGIGHPERFFNSLTSRGLLLQRCIAWPDHHTYQASNLPSDADKIIVTSKDAVKLERVIHDAEQRARLWVLPVQAEIRPDLCRWILNQLKIQYGR